MSSLRLRTANAERHYKPRTERSRRRSRSRSPPPIPPPARRRDYSPDFGGRSTRHVEDLERDSIYSDWILHGRHIQRSEDDRAIHRVLAERDAVVADLERANANCQQMGVDLIKVKAERDGACLERVLMEARFKDAERECESLRLALAVLREINSRHTLHKTTPPPAKTTLSLLPPFTTFADFKLSSNTIRKDDIESLPTPSPSPIANQNPHPIHLTSSSLIAVMPPLFRNSTLIACARNPGRHQSHSLYKLNELYESALRMPEERRDGYQRHLLHEWRPNTPTPSTHASSPSAPALTDSVEHWQTFLCTKSIHQWPLGVQPDAHSCPNIHTLKASRTVTRLCPPRDSSSVEKFYRACVKLFAVEGQYEAILARASFPIAHRESFVPFRSEDLGSLERVAGHFAMSGVSSKAVREELGPWARECGMPVGASTYGWKSHGEEGVRDFGYAEDGG